jgi:hypothetical protein
MSSYVTFYTAWNYMISTDKVFAVVLVAGLVFVVAHAQSRFDKCRAMGQKNIDCVLSFD